MLKKTRLSLAVGAAFSAGLVGFAPSALGQTAPVQPVTGQQLDRVEITGSLIRRSQSETALPVTTINFSELEKLGVTTAEQAVSFIAENQSAQGTSGAVGASTGGASYADLRGLGPQRTLVLVNGQRMVANPNAGLAVDLNSIPMVAIDRIEVLRDGASAIYGSDAIAGVINIIMRKEYQGINVSGQAELPQESGGKRYSASIQGGYGSLAQQGFNVFGGFSYTKQDVLKLTDRDYSASSFILPKGVVGGSGTAFPANYSQVVNGVTTVSSANPTSPNCTPPSTLPISATGAPRTNTCRQDTNRYVDNIPEQDLWSFFGKGSLALGADHVASIEYLRTYNEVLTNVAPTPLTSLTMPAASPFYPGNGVTPITNPNLVTTAPISLGWRTIDAGTRQQRHENTTQRVLGAIEGTVAGWSYKADAFYSDSEVKQIFTDGYVNRSRVLAGLQGTNGTPWLNPFGAQSAAGLGYLTSTKILGEVSKAEGTLWGGGVTASNEIFNLPAGPVSMAVGLNYLSDELTNTYDFSLIRNAQSSGLELATNTEGDRNVWGAVVEFSIPVIKNLDLSLAVRYDDYNDVGSTTNPKVGVRYQALNNLLLRGSYNTGFRAPSMFDLYQSPAVTFTANSYDDPVLCPNGVPVAGADLNRDCGQQFQRKYGGNVNTQPEESTAFTLGFVFDVMQNLSFSVDYWNQEVTGLIGTFPDSAVFAAPAANAAKYVRCSQLSAAERPEITQCNVPSTVDPLAYVYTPTDNLGDMKAQGFDLSVQWRGDATEWGRFGINLSGTYVTKFEQQLEKNGEWYNPLGRYSGELDFPVFRWQSVASVNWAMGAWSATLANRYRSGYRDANEAAVVAPYDDNTVGAYSVWDLVGSWSGVKGLTLSAGVINLFNETPPFSNQGSTFQQGYDPRFTNSLDRRWLLRASYEFK